jgi:hypothetical protein
MASQQMQEEDEEYYRRKNIDTATKCLFAFSRDYPHKDIIFQGAPDDVDWGNIKYCNNYYVDDPTKEIRERWEAHLQHVDDESKFLLEFSHDFPHKSIIFHGAPDDEDWKTIKSRQSCHEGWGGMKCYQCYLVHDPTKHIRRKLQELKQASA